MFHLEQKIADASAAEVAGMAWGKDCVDETQNDALRSKLRALGKILVVRKLARTRLDDGAAVSSDGSRP